MKEQLAAQEKSTEEETTDFQEIASLLLNMSGNTQGEKGGAKKGTTMSAEEAAMAAAVKVSKMVKSKRG